MKNLGRGGRKGKGRGVRIRGRRFGKRERGTGGGRMMGENKAG